MQQHDYQRWRCSSWSGPYEPASQRGCVGRHLVNRNEMGISVSDSYASLFSALTFWQLLPSLSITRTAMRSCRTRKRTFHFYSPGVVTTRPVSGGPQNGLKVLKRKCCSICCCVSQITAHVKRLINVYYLRRRRLCSHFGLFVCLSIG